MASQVVLTKEMRHDRQKLRSGTGRRHRLLYAENNKINSLCRTVPNYLGSSFFNPSTIELSEKITNYLFTKSMKKFRK